MKRMLGVFGIALGAGACVDVEPEMHEGAGGSISGRMIKGPVAAATIQVSRLEAPDTVLATAVSDARGGYKVFVGQGAGDLLLCGTGGTFVDEASGITVPLHDGKLCRIVRAFQPMEQRTGVPVTPWTSWVHASVVHGMAQGLPLETAYARARRRLGNFLGCGEHGTVVLDALPAADDAAGIALSAARLSAVLLQGLSEQAARFADANNLSPGATLNSLTLSHLGVRDLRSDGALDGHAAGTKLYAGQTALSSETYRGDALGLSHGVVGYLRSDRNESGLGPQDLRDTVLCMAASAGPLFGGNRAIPMDLDGPEVLWNTPTAQSVVHTGTVLTAVLSDPAGVASVRVEGVGGVEVVPVSGERVAFEHALSVGDADDGMATLKLVVTDSLGNQTEASREVGVDRAAPSLSLREPASGARLEGIVEVVAVAQDSAGIVSLAATLGGIPLVDLDPRPDHFRSEVDTAVQSEGPTALVLRAVDGHGVETRTDTPLVVDNLRPSVWRGYVGLETPLTGAIVEAWSADGTQLLGRSQSEAGVFILEVTDFYTGLVHLKAYGPDAAFISAATGAPLAMSPRDALWSIIEHRPTADGAEISHLGIHAWTTLAFRLRESLQGSGAENAMDQAFRDLGEHLRHPEGVDLRHTRPMDVAASDLPSTEEQRILAFAHVGMSRIAAHASLDSGHGLHGYNTFDLLDALAQDLEDNRLDGRNRLAELVHLTETKVLSTETLRSELAGEILRWLNGDLLAEQAGLSPPAWADVANFARGGGSLDDMSHNAGRLFGSEAPIGFDRQGPEIFTEGLEQGAAVRGSAALSVRAEDLSGIGDIRVEVEGRREPAVVVSAFSSSHEHVRAVVDTTLLPDAQHTLRITATDAVGNETERRFHVLVDNSPPEFRLLSPGRYINTTELVVELAIQDAGAGTAEARVSLDGVEVVAQAAGEGLTALQLELPGCGTFSLRVTVLDVLGNIAATEQLLTRDDVPPEVRVKGPSNLYESGRWEPTASLRWESGRAVSDTSVAELLGHGEGGVRFAAGVVDVASGVGAAEYWIEFEVTGEGAAGFGGHPYLVQDRRPMALDPNGQDVTFAWTLEELSHDFLFAGGPGRHVVHVAVSDRSGNVTERAFPIDPRPAAPVVTISGCGKSSELPGGRAAPAALADYFVGSGRTVLACDVMVDLGQRAGHGSLLPPVEVALTEGAVSTATTAIRRVLQPTVDGGDWHPLPTRLEACGETPYPRATCGTAEGHQRGHYASCGGVSVGVYPAHNGCSRGFARRNDVHRTARPTTAQTVVLEVSLRGEPLSPVDGQPGRYRLTAGERYTLLQILPEPRHLDSGRAVTWHGLPWGFDGPSAVILERYPLRDIATDRAAGLARNYDAHALLAELEFRVTPPQVVQAHVALSTRRLPAVVRGTQSYQSFIIDIDGGYP